MCAYGVCVCVWMTADSRCRGCPEPPLTQPTMLLSLGYPAMLRETSRNLEGSEFIWVHGRGRRQGKCTERKQEEEATRTWVRQDKWEEGECWEGKDEIRGRKAGEKERENGSSPRLSHGESRATCQPPAWDSSALMQGCCPAPLLPAGPFVSVSVPVCSKMDAAELRHSTRIRCITWQTS